MLRRGFAQLARHGGMADRQSANDAGSPARLVYVVDDDRDIRLSLDFALATSNVAAVPFVFPEDFLNQLDQLEPAPVILDVRMPKFSGIDVLNILRSRDIDWPVVIMTAHGDIPLAVKAMQLGAVDFLEKPFCLDNLDGLLEKAFGQLDDTVELARTRKAAASKLGQLTKREEETLGHLAKGLSNKLVARELGISPRTVEMYRSNALAKLGARNIAEAIQILFDSGRIAAAR